MILKNLNYPLDFKFKITTLSSDFNITDRDGNYVAYVREKIFKLKDDVIVYNNESKSQELFRIKANQWIDFNASFSITDLINEKNLEDLPEEGCVLSGNHNMISSMKMTSQNTRSMRIMAG